MFFSNEIQAAERITGGVIRALCYNPLEGVYDVKFEKDYRIECKKIPKRIVDKEVEKIKKLNISLDGLGGK